MGTELLPQEVRVEIEKLYTDETPNIGAVQRVYPFLKDKFRSFAVNKSVFDSTVFKKVNKIVDKYPKYIELPVQE